MKNLLLKVVGWAVRRGIISTEEITAVVSSAVTSKKLKPIVPRWIKKDGIIYFTEPFVANGWTAQQWKNWFGDNRSDWANQLLDSTDFHPTPKGTLVNLAILLGDLFTDGERITRNIRAKEEELEFVNPNPDDVLLLIKNFSVEEIREMGLSWIIGMHKPINDSDSDPGLLSVRVIVGVPWLDAYYGSPVNGRLREDGFVVAVPQV